MAGEDKIPWGLIAVAGIGGFVVWQYFNHAAANTDDALTADNPLDFWSGGGGGGGVATPKARKPKRAPKPKKKPKPQKKPKPSKSRTDDSLSLAQSVHAAKVAAKAQKAQQAINKDMAAINLAKQIHDAKVAAKAAKAATKAATAPVVTAPVSLAPVISSTTQTTKAPKVVDHSAQIATLSSKLSDLQHRLTDAQMAKKPNAAKISALQASIISASTRIKQLGG